MERPKIQKIAFKLELSIELPPDFLYTDIDRVEVYRDVVQFLAWNINERIFHRTGKADWFGVPRIKEIMQNGEKQS